MTEGGSFNTFFLFATALATGTSAALLLVPVRLLGRRFFVLMTFIAIVFVALATAARGLQTNHLHLSFAALLIVYNVILPRQSHVDLSERREAREGGPRRKLTYFSQAILFAATICGVCAVVADAFAFPVPLGIGAGQGAWLSALSLTSALLLGGSLVAMVLGHWYLVSRTLSFTPLARLTWLILTALVLRLAVTTAAAWSQKERWDALTANGWTAFLLDPGIFVLTRVVFGLAAPAALGWMTWRCVQIRANQSATGILYVNLAFVLIGEIIAKYFLVSAGLLI
jgi:hypothetical protein